MPTAQIVSLLFILPAFAILLWRHRERDADDDPPSRPEEATWGAPGRATEPEGDDLDEASPGVAAA